MVSGEWRDFPATEFAIRSRRVIRVLQLIEENAEFEARRGVDGLSRALGEQFTLETRTIGRGGDYRDVATAAATIRRNGAAYDIVHAWGGCALAAATLGPQPATVFSPAVETRRRTIGWVRAVLSYRDVQVICPTATLRRRLVERGVPIERCHLIRPGVEFGRINRRKDPALRARLRLSDDDHVLLAPGETTLAANHDSSLWAATVLHVADPKYKLLTWGRGPSIGRFRRFTTGLGALIAARQAEAELGRTIEFEGLLSAADTVLINATGAVATLPIAMCMAAALPIVSFTSYTVGELLQHGHNALMVGSNNPKLVAQRVLELRADSGLQWRIADMARTEAYEYFAFTRFVNQFRMVYKQLAAGEKVSVPEDAPGAGARFHSLGGR
jgi:glycosyltransferase involved in cell wall biosynthesis